MPVSVSVPAFPWPDKYAGEKEYIYNRIAFLRCSHLKPDVLARYRDFSSHNEAYDKAHALFSRRFSRRNSPYWVGPTTSSRTPLNNGLTEPVVSAAPTSQLLYPDEYNRLYTAASTSERGKVEPIMRSLSGQSPRAAAAATRETDASGQSFVAYPHSPVYFACPVVVGSPLADGERVKERLREFIRKHEAAGHTLQGKRVYCGREIQDIVKAKMCGAWSSASSSTSGAVGTTDDPFAALGLDIQELGSPGQCFQYGKAPSVYPDFIAD